jgi:FemAB-related protein (PEP-CTERM system-associated)
VRSGADGNGLAVIDIRVVTEQPDEEWRRVVERSGEARLAHRAEWFTVITRAYGHHPLYLVANDGHESCGVLPAFVVRRPLFGTVVTSMPFLDSGGPCSASPAVKALLVERLIAEARRWGARLVELRCAERLAIDAEPVETKVNMTLPLHTQPDVAWRRFDKGVRNQIRKAERSGLTVEHSGRAQLAAFYDAFVERMRDLGSPVHAFAFLQQVLDAFGPLARIVLVKKDGATIGGLVALALGNRLVVPWATCLKEHFALCPNMLLYWDTIRTACADGFTRFDFGRSTRHSGTYRFKRQWGAEEEPIFWYRIPIAARAATPATSPRTGSDLLVRIWQRLPLPVTRHVGPHIRKYLIQ